MTQLLEKAFAAASALSAEEQNAFAAFALAELESERKWAQAFEESQDELAQLGKEALAKHHVENPRLLHSDDL